MQWCAVKISVKSFVCVDVERGERKTLPAKNGLEARATSVLLWGRG